MDPLSRMAFDFQNDDVWDLAEKFEPAMASQHGMDVVCVPYSVTPFALEDAARSLSFQDGALEDARFDPPTVKSEFVRANISSPRDVAECGLR